MEDTDKLDYIKIMNFCWVLESKNASQTEKCVFNTYSQQKVLSP